MPRPGFTAKLLIAIAVIVAAALGIAFAALHRGTESDLRSGLDADLRAEVGQLERALEGSRSPQGALAVARRQLQGATFGRASQLLAVEVPGAGLATNQPELLGLPGEGAGSEAGEDDAEEAEEAGRILAVPPGYSEVSLDEAGEVRILSSTGPTAPGGPEATVTVGQPTGSIEDALSGLSQTFVLVGLGTLIVALLAGAAIASRLTAPLRRMAADSELVDRDLTQRIRVPGADDEVRRLADAFNRALDRLQAVFDGQQRFVADASHELRTPLTVIRGQIEVLAREEDPGPAEIARVSTLVTAEVDRMEEMAESMLTLAKGQSGPALRLFESDLAELAADAVAAMEVTADRRFEFSAGGSNIARVAPEQISQLVRILLRNAVEHTEPGGTVRVRVEPEDGRIAVLVEDDGPGIPPAERERVFERFHRAAAAPGGTGAGLGLAIAKAIVEAHEGTIAIGESPLGGARVSVTVPAVR